MFADAQVDLGELIGQGGRGEASRGTGQHELSLPIADVIAARSDWLTYLVRRKAEFEAEHPA
ncbi:hypothetical protein AB0F59_28960 [Micromonospora lupini]|uniref:hypothetical protein n=1 Tax=Micromonospora lupini TaxID=285679 RepID=UPI0033E9F22F